MVYHLYFVENDGDGPVRWSCRALEDARRGVYASTRYNAVRNFLAVVCSRAAPPMLVDHEEVRWSGPVVELRPDGSWWLTTLWPYTIEPIKPAPLRADGSVEYCD